jgi:hypothetical protein
MVKWIWSPSLLVAIELWSKDKRIRVQPLSFSYHDMHTATAVHMGELKLKSLLLAPVL